MKIKTWDVSGFGGSYEDACQKMIWNGVRFVQENRALEINIKEIKNVYGICLIEGKDGKAFDKAIMEDVDDATGAMHQCAVGHIRYIYKKGYDEWYKVLGEARRKGKNEQSFEYEYTPNFELEREAVCSK